MANPRIGAWATRAVGYLLVVTTVLLVVSVVQELVDGVTMSTNKGLYAGIPEISVSPAPVPPRAHPGR